MSVRVNMRLLESHTATEPEHEPQAIAVKTATSPDDMTRLAQEAQRLQQVSHPGVVRFIHHHVEIDRAELHTCYAGDSLERWSGTVAQVAGVTAAVATTVADLHEMGLVHGRIDRTHVLLGADTRPQLCGFAPAEPALEAADDVAAVGRLLEQMIDEAGTARSAQRRRPSQHPTGAGPRHWLARLRGPRAEQRALTRVIIQATDANVTRRPTARALARAILDAVPGAELPATGIRADGQQSPLGGIADREPETSDRSDLFEQAFVDQTNVGAEDVFSDRPWLDTTRPRSEADRHRRPWPRQSATDDAKRGRHTQGRAARGSTRAWRSETVKLVAAVAAVTGIIGGAALLVGPAVAGRDRPGGGDAAPSGLGETPVSGAIAADQSATGVPATCPKPDQHGSSSSSEHQLVDIDGNGCPEALSISDGVIDVAGERWAVGEPGDDIALGDWNCDGKATPAAYRRSTGDVFVFTEWAGEDRPLTVEPVVQVDGGVSLATIPISQNGTETSSCDAPAVELRNGQHRIVELVP